MGFFFFNKLKKFLYFRNFLKVEMILNFFILLKSFFKKDWRIKSSFFIIIKNFSEKYFSWSLAKRFWATIMHKKIFFKSIDIIKHLIR